MSLSAGDQLGVAAGCLAAMFILFVGLAELCDEWLVPWLEVIQKKTGMSDDLAGVTLVAFGSAAPELMISMVTVLSGDTDVGLGVVCGSAMIAFGLIPPMCYFAVNKDLKLTAWPVLRDALFYVVALLLLLFIIITGDGVVAPWICYSMFGYYVIYLVVVFNTRGMSIHAPEKPKEEVVAETPRKLSRRASTSLGSVGSLTNFPVAGEGEGEVSEETPLAVGEGDKEVSGGDGAASIASGEASELSIASGEASEGSEDEDEELSWWYGAIAKGLFGTLFSWTMPEPPEEGMIDKTPLEELPSDFMTFLGTLLAFVWLAALSEGAYEVVVYFCDEVSGFSELTVGAVILAFGSQIPDAVASISMTKHGHFDGAISSCISSQVIVVSIGLGLPWSLVSLFGTTIDLGTTTASIDFDIILVAIVCFISAVYLITTCAYSIPTTGFAVINKWGAYVTLLAFAAGYTVFIVLEVLSEAGVVLSDDGSRR